MKRVFLLLILILLALVSSLLVTLNAEVVHFDYYLASIDLPLSVLVFFVFAAGALFGLCCSLLMVLASLSERRRLRRQLALSQQEIRNLRDIPIKDSY